MNSYSRLFTMSAISTVRKICVSWWSRLFSHLIVIKTFSDLTERSINPVFPYLWSELWYIFSQNIFGLLVFPLSCFLQEYVLCVYLKSSHVCCGRHMIWFSIPYNKASVYHINFDHPSCGVLLVETFGFWWFRCVS